MKYLIFKCPLCCNQIFGSKQALIEHLKKYKLACSICSEEFLSITALIIHLDNVHCENLVVRNLNNEDEIKDTLYDVNLSETDENYEEDSNNLEEDESNCTEDEAQVEINFDEGNNQYTTTPEQPGNSDHIYSLLSSPEELTFTKDVDTSIPQYMIVAHDGAPAIVSGDKVITTQNVDGSVIFNLGEKDSATFTKTDAEPVITMTNKEEDLKNTDEVYNCNTCRMSFTSVLEHIKMFHNDQDVVVEVSENMVLNNTDVSNASKMEVTELFPNEKNCEDLLHVQNNKRIITDTGAIVDAKEQASPLHVKKEVDDNNIVTLVEQVNDKNGRSFKRKIVKTKSSDSGQTNKSNSFHQVIMKDMMTFSSEGNKKIRVYTCTTCSLYVTNIEQFSAYPCSPGSVKSKVLPCSECDSVYSTVKSLKLHMKQHKLNKVKKTTAKKNKLSNISVDSDGTKESSQNNSIQVEQTFTVPETQNMQISNNTEEESFVCDICSTEFVTNKSLKLHRRMHDPIKTRPIEPPVDSVKDDEFYCGYCNKMIPLGYRKVHEDYHQHEDINCDRCNKKFTSRVYLSMHMSVHNNEKVFVKESDKTLPYTCSFCDRRFARPHEKVKHERIHTGEKPHSCDICGKSFRVSYCLTLHMRTHTGARPYECHFCGKRFKAHSVYNHHLLTHSDVRAYKCPFCPKAFKTAVQLAGHKNSHTKPFSCETCNRPFASLYAVRVHSETHARDNSLKFSCELCGASYARTFALKDHMKQAHNQPDFNVLKPDVREGNNTRRVRVKTSIPIGGNVVPATIILSKGIS